MAWLVLFFTLSPGVNVRRGFPDRAASQLAGAQITAFLSNDHPHLSSQRFHTSNCAAIEDAIEDLRPRMPDVLLASVPVCAHRRAFAYMRSSGLVAPCANHRDSLHSFQRLH